MQFSRQEYWSGLPFPSPGDLPNPRIEPTSPALKADCLLSESAVKRDLDYFGFPSSSPLIHLLLGTHRGRRGWRPWGPWFCTASLSQWHLSGRTVNTLESPDWKGGAVVPTKETQGAITVSQSSKCQHYLSELNIRCETDLANTVTSNKTLNPQTV